MSPHVQEEMALVYSGGGRRYFTRKAALRGAAKAIIRDTFYATGDDLADVHADDYQRWVGQLVGKIERGDHPVLDFEDTSERQPEPREESKP